MGKPRSRFEGEGQIVEFVDDVVQPFVPIGAKGTVHQALDDGGDVAVEDGDVVGPGGYVPPGFTTRIVLAASRALRCMSRARFRPPRCASPPC